MYPHRSNMAAHFCLRLWLCVVLLGFGGTALADAGARIDLAQPSVTKDISNQLEFLIEPDEGSTDALAIRMAPSWQSAQAKGIQSHFKPATIWLRMHVFNSSEVELTRWLVVSPWRLAQVDLFEIAGDRVQAVQHSGLFAPVHQKPLKTVNTAFPVTLKAGESREFLLRLQDRTIPTVTVGLWQPDAYLQSQTGALMRESAYVAMGVAIFAMLLMQLDWRLTLLGAWLMLSLLSERTYEGQLLAYQFPALARIYPLLGTILFALSYGLFSIASMVFIGTGKPRWWSWILWALFTLSLGVALSTLFTPDHQVPRRVLSQLTLAQMLIWPLYAGWPANSKDARPAAILRLSFLMCWMVLVLRIVSAMGIIPTFYGELSSELRLIAMLSAIVSISLIYALIKRSTARALEARVNAQERDHRHRLEQEVTQRTEELQQAMIRSNQANQAKSDFLGRVSHDLRSPLTSIMGYAQLWSVSNSQLAAQGRIVYRNAKHMLSLVNDLIDYAMGGSEANPEEAPMYLNSVLNDAAQDALNMAKRHDNRFVLTLASTVPAVVFGDARRLRRMLLNLLDNAAKFTHGGTIQLTVDSQEAPEAGRMNVMLTIQDTGCGISADDQARIFEPFFHSTRQSPAHGWGLGLAIVQRLVAQMSGHLSLSSQVNQGTTIRVTIPLRVGSESDMGKTDMFETSAHMPSVSGSGHSVWIVEDNDAIRQLLRTTLESKGFVVRTFPDGLDFIRCVKEPRIVAPSLVLTDFRMPGADGAQVLAAARVHWPDTPVILLSATQQSMESLGAPRHPGFAASLMKPINLVELLQTLADVLHLKSTPTASPDHDADQVEDHRAAITVLQPASEILAPAFELVRLGAISDLQDYADQVMSRHPPYHSWAENLRQLATAGDLEALVRWVQPR